MTQTRSDGVAVLGHYGQLNLGDESITAAAIGGARRCRPGARVIAISLDPDDTRTRHGVESFALRRYVSRPPVDPPIAGLSASSSTPASGLKAALRRVPLLVGAVGIARRLAGMVAETLREIASLPASWRALRGIDLVIIAGSNQLLDQFGGAWGFPYSLLRWTLLARLRGARVVLLSVGAGPLAGKLACLFVRLTLRLSSYASVRDEGSARLVQQIGWREALPVRPDLAFSFEASPQNPRAEESADKGRSLVVGVNLMPVHDPRWWPGAKPEIHERYLAAVNGLVEDLLVNGHRVELYSTQPADEWIANDLLARMRDNPHRERLSLTRVRTLDQLNTLYHRCDILVPTRFHGILLALRFARPVLGICYYRKSRELMRDFGSDEFAFDLETVTADQLKAGFASLVADQARFVERVRRVAAEREADLEAQYRRVLSIQSTENARA